MRNANEVYSQLVAEQLSIARLCTTSLVGYVAIATGVYAYADIFHFDSDGIYFALSLGVWGLGYLLLVQLLKAGAAEGETMRGGIGGYFVLGLLISIAIIIGLVLLIVPGLYLMMRWLPAYARCGVASEGVFEAMDWSWKSTADMQSGLALATIGPVFAYAVAAGILVIQDLNWDELVNPYGHGWIIILNLSLSVSIAWFQLLGVAAYRTIERQSVDIVKTFD